MLRRFALCFTFVSVVGLTVSPSIAALAPNSSPPAEPATETIRVATKPLVPFVDKRSDGSLAGFSIELWDEIARRNQWTTEWIWNEKVDDVLDAVTAGTADAGIAGISMTAEREAVLDFSYPMFNSGLQVMATPTSGGGFTDTLRELISTTLRILFALGGLTCIAAHAMWLINRGKDDWPQGYLRGVGHGWWISVSTLLANDPGEPRRVVGRVISILWVLTGIVFVAYFTADLASSQTVESIQGTIRGVEDLPGKSVVTVAGTTSAKELDARGISYTAVSSIDAAFEELVARRADALVFDSPVLLYYAATKGRGQARVVGGIFKPEPYGIAMPVGSPHREQINEVLLAMQADGFYQRLYDRYFSAS